MTRRQWEIVQFALSFLRANLEDLEGELDSKIDGQETVGDFQPPLTDDEIDGAMLSVERELRP